MATQSSILAWKIPWTKEPGRLQPMGSQRIRHNWATSLSFLSFASMWDECIYAVVWTFFGNCLSLGLEWKLTFSSPVATTKFSKFAGILSAAAAKSPQSCLTLCDPIDGSSPGSPILGILQARTLEWVAISLSNAWKWKVKGKSLSRVRLIATPWTAAHQAPPSMGFSRQEYWSGLPLPFPTPLYDSEKSGTHCL